MFYPESKAAGARSGRRDLVLLLPALAFFGIFFFVYVPLLPPFLSVLAPLLVLTVLLTSVNRKKGLLFFIFLFPLIGNLPNYFGIFEHIPHAPAALVLFLAFFLGCLINGVLFEKGPEKRTSFGLLLRGAGLLVLVSAGITFLRYLDFVPVASETFRDLVVNVIGVRAGGAVMSDVFNALFYLTGFLFFAVLSKTLRSWEDVGKAAGIFTFSMSLSLVFALVQAHHSIGFGNSPFWVHHGQVNGTFSDPNSFSGVLSSGFPLFLGLALTGRKKIFRIFGLAAGILALTIFPSIGSRSGFAALAVSLSFYAAVGILRLKGGLQKKVLLGGLAIGCIVLVLGGLLLTRGDSILKTRLTQNETILGPAKNDGDFFNMRLRLWKGSLLMMRDYPLTGVGIGAFIVEYPNYMQNKQDNKEIATDSALNFFLQSGAELGGAGILLLLLLLFEILRRMMRSLRAGDKENIPLLMGASAGIVAFLVNFQFHSYVGNPEVFYFFWLLVAMVSFGVRPEDRKIVGLPIRSIRTSALIFFFIFGGVLAWNSWKSLSIPSETEKYGWVQNYNFYQSEKDENGKDFHWIKAEAGLSLPVRGKIISLTLLASHPDLDKKPVRTKIYLADRHFRKTQLLTEAVLDRNVWVPLDLPIPSGTGSRIWLIFETDREWRPQGDPRSLAIALRPVFFK